MSKQILIAAAAIVMCCVCAVSDVMAEGGIFAKRDLLLDASSIATMRSTPGIGRPAGTHPVCLPPAGRTSTGPFYSFDAGNSVVFLNIGVGNAMTGASVDAAVEALAPSWLSNSMILFSSGVPDDPGGIIFLFGHTDGPGVEQISTGGVLRLSDSSYANVAAGADGFLRLEWFDGNVLGNNPRLNPRLNPNAFWSNAAAPAVCQGIHITCTDQAACDAAVGSGVMGPPAVTSALPVTGKSAAWILLTGLALVVFLKRKHLLRGR